MDTYKARDLMRLIAEGTHVCGDPGMQFDTTINEWHTCPKTDRIYASNPCSEYMFLNDSACNLASINLMKFVREDGEFDVVALQGRDPHAASPRRRSSSTTRAIRRRRSRRTATPTGRSGSATPTSARC